jgi:hypothetical protein
MPDVHIRLSPEWSGQLLAESRIPGIKKDGFDRQCPLRVTVELPPPLGLPDIDPVGRPVARAREVAGIGKGFEEHRAEVVTGLPVPTSCWAARAKTAEARYFTWTQGRIKNRALLTTSGQCRSRSVRVQPMKRSRGASAQGAGAKADGAE